MTAYFDRFESDVANAGRAPVLSRWQRACMTVARWLSPVWLPRPVATWDALYALDERIVRDVSIAVMMPTVPARGGVEVRPEHRARLIALGVRSVRPADARRVPVGQPVIVDDAAPRWRARKTDGPWDVARLESLVYQAPIHTTEVIQ